MEHCIEYNGKTFNVIKASYDNLCTECDLLKPCYYSFDPNNTLVNMCRDGTINVLFKERKSPTEKLTETPVLKSEYEYLLDRIKMLEKRVSQVEQRPNTSYPDWLKTWPQITWT